MDTSFVLADSFAQSANDLAFSALPNAPVLPYVAPRHRIRRFLDTVGDLSDRLHIPLPGAPRRREACSL
jgi:hypothetical protein